MIPGALSLLLVAAIIAAVVVAWMRSPRGWLPGATYRDAAGEAIARLFPNRPLAQDPLRARLWRVVRNQVSIGVQGNTIVPSTIELFVSPSDHETLDGIVDFVTHDLEERLVETARKSNWRLVAQPIIVLTVDEQRPSGRPTARSSFLAATQADAGQETEPSTDAQLDGLSDAPTFLLRSPGPHTLGKDRSCTLTLSGDPAVSRRHAELFHHRSTWSVRDLGSTNGVAVNGRRISGDQPLAHGDELRLSSATVFVFRDAAGAPTQSMGPTQG